MKGSGDWQLNLSGFSQMVTFNQFGDLLGRRRFVRKKVLKTIRDSMFSDHSQLL
jgi:hypothetical protein